MKFSTPRLSFVAIVERLRGMFNLNDSRWGRADEAQSPAGSVPDAPANPQEPSPAGRPEVKPDTRPDVPPPNNPANDRPSGGQRPGTNAGPPDLDELWRDFNRKLNGWIGSGKRGGGARGTGSLLPPDFKNIQIGGGVIAAVLVLIWLATLCALSTDCIAADTAVMAAVRTWCCAASWCAPARWSPAPAAGGMWAGGPLPPPCAL